MSLVPKPLTKLPIASRSIKQSVFRHKLNIDCESINNYSNNTNEAPQSPSHRHTLSYGRIMPKTSSLTQMTLKIKPSIAITPSKALFDMYNMLSSSEYKEISQYKELYYFGLEKKTKETFIKTDEDGYYKVIIGDHLLFRYEILEELGQGSFGTVVKCKDHKTDEIFAIKIMRKTQRILKFGRREVEVLNLFSKKINDANSCIVEKIDQFYFREHLCIVFELLTINLYDFIKRNHFQGISQNLARRITTQVLIALKTSHELGIIHCDVKPENIVFKQENKSGIKLIDFGSTCTIRDKCYGYIQSRFYRAPEVILEYDYNVTIDVWSLGCVVVEMVTGWPLFAGDNEKDVLQQIVNIIGQPPKEVLLKAKRVDKLNNENMNSGDRNTSYNENAISLDQLLEGFDSNLIDFVKRCIVWEKNTRITVEEGLIHPWIRGTHSS
ncbi:hypothetical protein SteCoe_26579 [Stentor coeruleus]|uniref:dual-specificity kinase n=1 Tax=Stentor coeruleus TaxID=5963 RepID=A0A1R2BCI3_9CILI|nr:hypothetical protein SteCoe_26579 [Stentor coeruleus]